MELHAKLVRSQLNFFKPLAENCSLELTRKGQDKLGELMTAMHRRETFSREHDFRNFQGAWIMPKDERRTGVILYLHGGGYTCGSLEYARGFASTLATECGVRVFCAAYRLAPEHPFPAAVDDAMKAWDHLMRQGYGARDVTVAGDSAGGNLALVLCHRLKQEGRRLPARLILMSPWTDMTASGKSYTERAELDPTITLDYIRAVRGAYARDQELTSPMLSPLFGDFRGFPPTLIQAGSNELLLSDSVRLRDRMQAAGVPCRLEVWSDMWHVFQMFPIKKAGQAMASVGRFLLEYT